MARGMDPRDPQWLRAQAIQREVLALPAIDRRLVAFRKFCNLIQRSGSFVVLDHGDPREWLWDGNFCEVPKSGVAIEVRQ